MFQGTEGNALVSWTWEWIRCIKSGNTKMACSKLLGFFTNSIIRVINVDYINLYLLRKRVQFYIIVILHYYATYNNLVSPFKILIRHVDLKVKIACYHRASTTPICISFSFSLYVICTFPSLCMSSAFFIRKMYSVLVKYTAGVGRRTEGERTWNSDNTS